MNLAHIDELERIEMPDGFVWRPIRSHFGIGAFGANAYTSSANGQIVEEHTEERLGHEEIYLVLRGRVRFTVGGNDHELGQGQLVFVRDPSIKRGGVALTDDAVVFAVGGKPGEAFQISAWEWMFRAAPHISAGQHAEAKEILLEGIEATANRPRPALFYNLACVEALSGQADAALEHLNEAVSIDATMRDWAKGDSDFDSIRDDPRFPS